MPRRVTVELTDDQAEILDALAVGAGIDPDALLVQALGKGLTVMIADVEHFGPGDETHDQNGPEPLAPYRPRPASKQTDLDDGLPF